MNISSNQDFVGLVNHLYLASDTALPSEEVNRLFYSLNTAVSHLQAIKDDERIADIRLEMLQRFRVYASNSHKTLVQWLCLHSIKISEDRVCGPITSFLDLLSSLDGPQSNTSECSTLALTTSDDSYFPPLKYVKKAIRSIHEPAGLRKNYDRIFETLNFWKELVAPEAISAKTKQAIETLPLTTKKQKIFEKTEKHIKHLKHIQESNLSNDLNLIISQQSTFFNSYPWEEIATWIVDHSFSEYDGAYQLFDEFMQLIFGIHPLPNKYIVERAKTLKKINDNKENGVTFTDFFDFADLRNTYFKKKILGKMSTVSKKNREIVINQLISKINKKEISNQTLHLDSIPKLIAFFGEENCKRLTRLVFNHTVLFCVPEIVEYTPNIQRLSSYCTHNANLLQEETLKKLTQLESLKFSMYEESVDLNFLKYWTSLKGLKIFSEHYKNFDILASLKNLKKLQIKLTSLDRLQVLQQLPELNHLVLRTNLDLLDLQNLCELKKLELRGRFGKFHFQNKKNITHLLIETSYTDQEIVLKDLPALSHLIMNNIASCKCQINNLPALQELDLRYNFCDINGLKNSTQLTKLALKNPQLSSDITWIKDILSLEILDLSDSKVTDITPLRELPNLKTLNLSNCTQLNDKFLEDILLFPSLKELKITRLSLSEEMELKLKSKEIILEYNSKGIILEYNGNHL